jgi:phage terminase large subunit-like protein
MTTKIRLDILKAIDDPEIFGNWFRDPATWRAWRAFLAALFALPMDADQLALFQEFTGRKTAPAAPFNESYLICGRRSGKSAVLAVVAVYLACFRSYRQYLAPGEVATIRIMASDRDQSRTILRYIGGLMRGNAQLARRIVRETSEAFELNNRVVIEVGSASFRAARGYSFAAVLADELAFWRSEESTNPDVEILRAIRPGLMTIPNSKLLIASSPYARKGALWDAFQRYSGLTMRRSWCGERRR